MAFERYHIGELMGDVHGNDITYLFVALKKIECFLRHIFVHLAFDIQKYAFHWTILSKAFQPLPIIECVVLKTL